MRGIGVAVITSMSGAAPLAESARRWCTPKRCCSSTTTRPRRWNSTPAWKSACVPTTICASPLAIRASASLRSAAPSLPVSSTASMPAASASGAMVAKCWRARSSVGAISAAWPPASTTSRHGDQRDDRLARADVALQQPQHARPRRRGRARSRPAPARCEPVRLKGRAASIFCAELSGDSPGGAAAALQAAAHQHASASWLATSSSKASRCQAAPVGPEPSTLSGRWTDRKRVGEGWPAARREEIGREPFRQLRQPVERRCRSRAAAPSAKARRSADRPARPPAARRARSGGST